MKYDYVIIGAGIAGCCSAYFLSKYSDSILLIDRNYDVAQGASGAAGAFLSPLLGKPNKFKELVTNSLNFSSDFYKQNIAKEITNCGTLRIPKNNIDRVKFESYKEHMDFFYSEEEEGYFFDIGSQVNAYNVCNFLAKNIEKRFNYEVEEIERVSDFWLINGSLKAKKLIMATGADISLTGEKYFKIRAVWGQKIDIFTSTYITKNYHKECSISSSKYIDSRDKYLVSIGATHHRFNCDSKICNYCIKSANINKMFSHSYTESAVNDDTKRLLELANDIKKLDNVEVCDIKIGARASSVDYFPLVGKLINSKLTLKNFPHLVNGSHINDSQLSTYNDLFVLNGVGGRGFVLSPYLAYNLVEHIIKDTPIEESVLTQRMFKRWVKKG